MQKFVITEFHLYMAELFIELLSNGRWVTLVLDSVDDNLMETLMFMEVKLKLLQDFIQFSFKIFSDALHRRLGLQNFQQGLPQNGCKTVVFNELSVFFAGIEFL